MKNFKSTLTNGINDTYKCHYLPSYLLNAIDNNYGDKRDEKILELVNHIANEFFNYGASSALAKTTLPLDSKNIIRNSLKIEY